ncbi:type II secretion system F family protein [Candidatus Ruminimicrobiellum ovillum]|uniref:type II secretion system F family protein n=1 Tax=Candidatus Ruminimicrobiellum ovillum TaxID=1947927 RepID=UPI0035594633
MSLNIVYLLLFLISFCLLVFYSALSLKSKDTALVKNKNKKQSKKRILLLIICFVLISVLLNVIYAIIITVAGVYCFWLFTENKKQKYKKEIDKQILETIRLFRNSVSSGENIIQAIESVSCQIKDPLSSEFKEILKKVELGIGLDKALKDSTDKIQNEQYKFFMDSLKISHSTGIKISDILSKIEQSVSKKLYLANKVDVLTSQVRFSGMVISTIPFFIIFIIYFIEPEMVSILFSSVLGNIILLVCVIMILSGSFMMKKIADIKL